MSSYIDGALTVVQIFAKRFSYSGHFFARASYTEDRPALFAGLLTAAKFFGGSGTGKTHCLIAISLAACTLGYRTLFTTAAGLLTHLLDAKRDGTLSRKLQSIDRFAFLAIDELGYVPFEREATDILFQVISQRYERSSVAITTNLAFEQWTQIFPDAMAAKAVVDRLIHHGSVYEFTGESHRLRSRATQNSAHGGKSGAK